MGSEQLAHDALIFFGLQDMVLDGLEQLVVHWDVLRDGITAFIALAQAFSAHWKSVPFDWVSLCNQSYRDLLHSFRVLKPS